MKRKVVISGYPHMIEFKLFFAKYISKSQIYVKGSGRIRYKICIGINLIVTKSLLGYFNGNIWLNFNNNPASA